MVAGAALSIPAFLLETDGSFYHHTFGFTCSYLAAGMILVASLYSPILGTALFRPVVFVGARSYSIYLWHVPTGVWLFPLLRQYTADAVPTALWYALYVGGPVLIGTAFAWVIEYPVLKLRDRFFPSRSNPLLAEPASGATPSPVGMAPRADAVLGDAGAPCRPCAVSEPSN
jgi:peptidoglycan/LPS O-acetylase OafA/YrhL